VSNSSLQCNYPLYRVICSPRKEELSVFRKPTTRRRDIANTIHYPAVLEDDGSVYVSPRTLEVPGKQLTVSEGHRKNHLTNSYEEGGPFYTVKAEYHIPYTSLDLKVNLGPYSVKYSGPVHTPVAFAPHITTEFLESFRSQDTSDLDPYGAEAVARCAPTSPVAELNSGIAEFFREGIPSLPGKRSWERRIGIVRSAASEFLNAEFGWLPLLDEVKESASAVSNATKILEQYERDAGNLVHRKYRFPTERTETSTYIGSFSPEMGGTNLFVAGGGTGDLTVTIATVTDRWFSGAFTYAVPSSLDSWQRMLGYGSSANKLLGTALTPDVLWNLTPWSWAIDWFTDTQEVIQNLEAFKLAGLVMPYGYIMEEKSKSYTYSMGPVKMFGHDGKPFQADVPPNSLTITSKVRRPANPFGFGVDFADLSPLQLAIAAAVGISLL
jgi:hypothetical protein